MRDFEDILDNLDLEVDENSILPPPNTKEVSICVFCSGEITSDEFTVEGGFHCTNCGLKYKFRPKAKVTI